MSDLQGKIVIVTGADGFIGYHLTQRLLKEGASVHALDLQEGARISKLTEHCTFHAVDLRDFTGLRRVCKECRPEIVFHLGAMVNVDRSPDMLRKMMDVNFQGTVNLLNALDNIDYQCFINTGTCEEYGDNPVPFREDQCPNPVSPYSLSKAAATLYCSMLVKTHGTPIVTIRPFLTYGPFQISNMLIPATIMKAIQKDALPMTKAEQTREFNFVEDIVDGYVKAATTPEAIGEVINIGNGIEFTIKEVVTKILALLGNPIRPSIGALPYRKGETWHFYCDNAKARKILKWTPQVSLEEGLRKTIDWYLENPSVWKD